MSFAVIKTGGKQYLVEPGTKLKIEKLPIGQNGEVVFGDVLLLEKDGNLEIGKPKVEGAEVVAKVLKEGKAKKIVVFKYKAKKRYKVKKGHRQQFLEVEIQKI